MLRIKAFILCLLLILGIAVSSDATLVKVNFGASTIVSDGSTTITIAAGDHSMFPTSGQFAVTIWPAAYTSASAAPFREIVYLTYTSGDAYSASRARESTTQFAWAKGDHIAATITAGVFDDYVLKTVTVNGSPLSSNITISAANLGLTIGTNVQAYNANLTSYAGVAPSANALTLLGHSFASMLTDIGAQAALTNPVTGTGTSGYLAKFSGTSAINNGPKVGATFTDADWCKYTTASGFTCDVTPVTANQGFNTLTSGTNTTAAFVVGSGATLGYSGTGTIDATTIAGTAPSANMLTLLGSLNYATARTNLGVPTSSTTVNGHALTGNVTVTNSDLGAVPTSTTVNGHALSGNVTVTNGDLGAVPTTTTVNGHALSSNVTVTNADLGAVPTTTTVNGHALSGNVVVSAADITTGTLPNAQLPSFKEVPFTTSGNLSTADATIGSVVGNCKSVVGPVCQDPTTDVTVSAPNIAVGMRFRVYIGNTLTAPHYWKLCVPASYSIVFNGNVGGFGGCMIFTSPVAGANAECFAAQGSGVYPFLFCNSTSTYATGT